MSASLVSIDSSVVSTVYTIGTSEEATANAESCICGNADSATVEAVNTAINLLNLSIRSPFPS